MNFERHVEPLEVAVEGAAQPAAVLPARVEVEVLVVGLLLVRLDRAPLAHREVRLDAADPLRVGEDAPAVAVVVELIPHAIDEAHLGIEVAPDLAVGPLDLVRGVVVDEVRRSGVLTAVFAGRLRARHVVEPVRVPPDADIGVDAVGAIELAPPLLSPTSTGD